VTTKRKANRRWKERLYKRRAEGAAQELGTHLNDLARLANYFELTPLEMSRLLKLCGWWDGPTFRELGSGHLLTGRYKRLNYRRKKLLAFIATYYRLLGDGTIDKWKRKRRKEWRPRRLRR